MSQSGNFGLIDLVEQNIQVFQAPSETGYRRLRSVTAGENLTPEALPELTLAAAEILRFHD